MGRFASEIFNYTVPNHLEAAAVIYGCKGEFNQAASYQKKALDLLDASTSAEAHGAGASQAGTLPCPQTIAVALTYV
jgi:hypothetical protein